MKAFHETLRMIPATAQERIYARSMLVFPIALLTLALFWIISGFIGFWQFNAATDVFQGHLTPFLRTLLVAGGGILDIAIGVGLLVRPLTRKAAIASLLLAGTYLMSALLLTPHLWTDPLGPMVKVFPAMALALVVTAMAETR